MSPGAEGREPRRVRLLGKIGQGGMAEVFAAAWTPGEGAERDVAVKRLRPELEPRPRFAEMFSEEARTLSTLSHPNVVAALDVCRDGEGRLCIVMERVDGWSLAELLRTGPVPAPVAAFVATEVLSALGHAHSARAPGGRRGVVHCDLSPSNVLLSRGGSVKVADFGIARAMGQAEPRLPAGTPEYSAPEALLGRRVDGRADLFAVGLLLWEMLVGRRPFPASTARELLARMRSRPPRASALMPDVPRALDAAAARLLAASPSDRPRDAEDAASSILAWEGMPPDGQRALATLLSSRLESRGRGGESLPAPRTRGSAGGRLATRTCGGTPAAAARPPELTFDSYVGLLDAAGGRDSPSARRDAALAHLAFHAGLRAAELSAMDLAHLDLEGRRIVGPLSDSRLGDLVVHALERYVAERPKLVPRGERMALFVSDRGRRLGRGAVVRRLLRPHLPSPPARARRRRGDATTSHGDS